MIRGVIAFLATVFVGSIGLGQVVVDGFFDEWTSVDQFDDAVDDNGNGIDIVSVKLTDDNDRLYILLELDREINYQDDGALAVYIDADNNRSTGISKGQLGYEVAYLLGQRRGLISENNGIDDVGFEGMGFVALPTISSRIIEMSFLKSAEPGFADYDMEGEIAIQVYDDDGRDRWPDQTPYEYRMQNVDAYQNPNTFAAPTTTDFRITSYNSLQNGLLGSRGGQQAIYMQNLAPDIMLWQELYDANNPTMRDELSAVTQSWDNVYVSTVSGIGVAIVSRFPILDEVAVDGNAAYLLDVMTDTILIVNVHYPCCDNDFDRQAEVDRVMQFIREARLGLRDMDVPASAPTIIMGDMNLVGSARQYATMITGDILINSVNGPDFAPDVDGTDMADVVPKVLGTNLAYTWYSPGQSFSPGRLDLCIYTDSRLDLLNGFCYQPSTNQPSDHLPVVADFAIKPLVVSTDDLVEDEALRLSPIPASDILHLEGQSSPYKSIGIFDMQGRRCLYQSSPSATVDVSTLPVGMYVVLAETDRGTLSSKIAIIR